MGQKETVLFDTHVHLDAPPLGQRLGEEVRQARMAGVCRFLVPGVDREGWPGLMGAVRSVPGALAAPGLHPQAAGRWNAEAAARLRALLRAPEVAAVGEIGLDGLLEAPSPDIQERAFREQLRLAVEADLPVVIHCRRAAGRLAAILREEGAQRVGGILHAFSGSLETALEGISLGFAIGFGGTLTYPGARRAPEVLARIPAEWVVLETDAPDLAPHPHRGEANRPCWLPLVARRVAEIRGWTEEEVARITTANAEWVLKIGN
jgi:TatD DNase family protein